MIDWLHGGINGSLTRWVRRDVREQLRTNKTARSARYGAIDRLLRYFLEVRTFANFIAAYLVVDLTTLIIEWAITKYYPIWFNPWTQPGITPSLTPFILTVETSLIAAQVAMLGTISIAIGLVTIIGERGNTSTDITLYYHESMAFQITASSIALLVVLSFQLGWPLQFAAHRFGMGTSHQLFKLALLAVHLLWLLVNLASLAHFIETTFRFVRPTDRQRLRERYTANFVVPADLTKRLREQLYHVAGIEMSSEIVGHGHQSSSSVVTFGYDFGQGKETELRSHFRSPKQLADVRFTWVRWAVFNWARRCKNAGFSFGEKADEFRYDQPDITFGVPIDAPRQGIVVWCTRRGGLPLNWLEKAVLRASFHFVGGRAK